VDVDGLEDVDDVADGVDGGLEGGVGVPVQTVANL